MLAHDNMDFLYGDQSNERSGSRWSVRGGHGQGDLRH
jgi:hypothetical protein